MLVTMRKRNSKKIEISTLIQLTNKDPVIKKRILELLQLGSFERRFELNLWLEKLRQRNASENLRDTLLILFDDLVAEQILKLIYDSRK
jgi:hypothetical protein